VLLLCKGLTATRGLGRRNAPASSADVDTSPPVCELGCGDVTQQRQARPDTEANTAGSLN